MTTEARIAMMPMTTSTSMRVKARLVQLARVVWFFILGDCMMILRKFIVNFDNEYSIIRRDKISLKKL